MLKIRARSNRSTSATRVVNPTKIFVFVMTAAVLIMPTAHAFTNNFTGFMDGSEPTSSLSFDFCGQGPVGPYDLLGPLTVTASGEYSYTDISISASFDMQLTIYSPSFDDANPTTNQVPLIGNGANDVFDDTGTVILNQNTPYFLVVQSLCNIPNFIPGTWEFSLEGPGVIRDSVVSAIPTLSPLGLALASLLMAAAAFLAMRRRKMT